MYTHLMFDEVDKRNLFVTKLTRSNLRWRISVQVGRGQIVSPAHWVWFGFVLGLWSFGTSDHVREKFFQRKVHLAVFTR